MCCIFDVEKTVSFIRGIEQMAGDAQFLWLFAIVILFHVGAVHSREWNTWQDNGDIRYSSDCEFKGHEINKHQVPDYQCRDLCISNSKCTHYTWLANGNLCSLKFFDSNETAVATDLKGAVCGYIPSRVNLLRNLNPITAEPFVYNARMIIAASGVASF